MSHFRPDGAPVGINYTKAVNGNRGSSIVARAAKPMKDTNFGVDNGSCFVTQYKRAVDHRLAGIGEYHNEELRRQMHDAMWAFMKRYRLSIEPVTVYRLVQQADQ